MRIFVDMVANSTSPAGGGVTIALRDLAASLAQSGVGVRVLSLKNALADNNKSFAPSVLERHHAHILGYSPGLRRALSERREGIVHQHGLWHFWSRDVARLSQRMERPAVISPHGMLDPWALRNSAWKKRLAMVLYEDRNLRSAACLHALNESEARSIRELGLTNPIAIIPNGVTLPGNSDGHRRPEFLNGDDRKLVLFLGRIHPKKGIAETLRAWSTVLQRRPQIGRQWALVIAGWDDGNHLAVLKSVTADMDLDRHVYFPGPQFGANKVACLENASAFILASQSEGLPVAVLEAWSHALPVIITSRCNLSCGARANAAVECEPPFESIADALECLLTSSDSDRQLMGRNGRTLVEREFNWARIAQEMISVYHWMQSGGPMPACIRERGI